MKHFYIFLSLLFLSVSIYASQNRKVLIIGIDGTRPDALLEANAPTIDSLAATGLRSFETWHTGITWSAPSWCDIMCGVYEDKHGVTFNTWTGRNFDEYPYFVNRAKEVKPDLYAVQVAEWADLTTKVYNDGFDEKIITACDGCQDASNNTAQLACDDLSNDDLDMMFLYFDQVDHEGHLTGFSKNNAKYITAIEYVDVQINKVMNCLRARPNFASEDWLVLLITDHGGRGIAHGGGTVQERKIWWIASGAAVDADEVNVPDPGTTYSLYQTLDGVDPLDPAKAANTLLQVDIAVTALHHLLADSIGDTIEHFIERWDLDGKSWLRNIPTPVVDSRTNDFEIRLFPNPVNDALSIWVERKNFETLSYSIVDISGKVVKHASVPVSSNITIDCSDLPNAQYALNIELPDGQKASKLFLKQ